MNTDIHIILEKLDSFIKKFYLNEFIKGLVLFGVLFTFYFTSIFLLEYFSFFSPLTRTILFYTSIFISIIGFIWYILIPLFHVFKIGKTLNYEQASAIISKHFPEVKDSLLNTLQLSSNTNLHDNSLAIAAINQKITQLRPIPFSTAVSYKSIVTYGKYAAVILLLIVLSKYFYPDAFSNGATRIFKYSEVFEKPAPFQFSIENEDLSVIKGDDITIKLKITGEYVPQKVYFTFSGNSFLMKQTTKNQFEYTCNNCNNSFNFSCKAEEYTSKTFTVEVQAMPQLVQFNIQVQVPQYTGLSDFEIQNTGDITIPQGSKIHWSVSSADAESMSLLFKGDSSIHDFKFLDNQFILDQTVLKTTNYSLQASNKFIENYNIIQYTYNVIPDVYPSIQTISQRDSAQFFLMYFKGRIQDDYGFSNLQLVWYSTKNTDSIVKIPIQYNAGSINQEFFYMHDFSQFSAGDSIVYYFETADNDKIIGPKSTKTSVDIFAIPTFKEIQQLQDDLKEDIEQSIDESKDLTKEVLKDIKNIQEKLLNQNLSDWERNQLLDQMKQKQTSLQQQLKEMTQKLEQKNELQNQFDQQSQEILDKQQQIQDLLKNLMDDELQKLLEEFNKMMDDFKKDDFFKISEDMKLSYEELQKQLDRDLELLKRADVEQQIQNTANKLEELSKKQQELSEKTKNGDASKEELQKQQDNLSKEFNDLKDSYKDAQEKNKELENSFQLPDFDKEFQDIEQSQELSQDQLQNNQKNKSSKSMEQSSEGMQSLGQKMQEMMNSQTQSQAMEDMDNLRQILDNLLAFSFEQEQLLTETQKLSFTDPKYASVASKQNSLKENYNSIKDSLYNLSLRVPQISSTITNEMFEINKSMRYTLDYLEQRQRSGAVVKQQYIMTSTNNLTLLLSEVLDAMQEAQAKQMSGQQQCQKPSNGKGSKSMPQLQQMQKSLKEQMQQMMQQMKDGSMPMSQQSKQLSKMLAEQQMMQQMMNNMLKDGGLSPDGVKELKEIQKMMEQVEQDIVFNRVSEQTILRQQKIMSRLLESEKAENERDLDEKRESKQALDKKGVPVNVFEEQKGNEIKFEDNLEQTNLKLNSYYKKIFINYIQKINDN